MKPSVGRIVHYTGFGDEQNGECYAALVTRVRDETIGNVDLLVFPPTAKAECFAAPDTTGGSDEPGHGQWHWPERVE